MISVRSTMCCLGAAVDTVGSSSGRFSISAYDRARETSEKIAINKRIKKPVAPGHPTYPDV